MRSSNFASKDRQNIKEHDWTRADLQDLSGKLALITGGAAGIGF